MEIVKLESNQFENTLPIRSDATVYSYYLEKNKTVSDSCPSDWGIYLYVLGAGLIELNKKILS